MSVTRNYSIDEAADILRCKPRFLEDNLARLPHQKIGASVAFDDDELAAIKDMHRVRPRAAAEGIAPRSLAQIRPKGARIS
ncbi:hypothetical protein ACFUJR_27925 [Streptomyces sp. NPDC057271]|uniref:hypothetical protein n=1 Tax=unclassified Streptomyces TaxID=2593676 RepID=UPI003634CF90